MEATQFNWQRVGPFVWYTEHGHRYRDFFAGYVTPQIEYGTYNNSGELKGYYDAVIMRGEWRGPEENKKVTDWAVEWYHKGYKDVEWAKQQLTRVLSQRCFCDACEKYMWSGDYGKIAPNSLEALNEVKYVMYR